MQLSKEARFAMLLDDMGFILGGIHEAILTTVNRDGSFNPAPMGVFRAEPEILELRPFKFSATYENLLQESKACVNLTNDPMLYLVTAFKDEVQGYRQPTIDERMRLNEADAYIFVKASEHQGISENRARFMCQIEEIEAEYTRPQVFSRGKAEAIEAVIHATRIKTFSSRQEWGDLERLIKLSAECKDVVERVSPPGSVEMRVVEELERMILRWRGTK
ncbi:MAG: DUF447 family protein [Candidatus Bathyarchaeota archaeon]|jgi:hypothetical protein